MSDNPKAKHKQVEAYLREEKRKFQQRLTEPSAILLGSADSGKSTLLRQLKLVNGIGFTEEEIANAKIRIEKNLFSAVAVGMANKKVSISNAEIQFVSTHSRGRYKERRILSRNQAQHAQSLLGRKSSNHYPRGPNIARKLHVVIFDN